MNKRTDDETPIENKFDEVWQKKNQECKECDFSKMYVYTRRLFVNREEIYVDVLENIAQIVNPNAGMCGRAYTTLPKIIEQWLDNRGDKAKMNIELKKLREENAQLALQIVRGSK